MSNLVSSWSKNVQAVPESYILPEEKRPGDIPVPLCKDIPVVDLARVEGLGRYEVVQTMMKASQDFGNFQVHLSLSLFFGYQKFLVRKIRT